MSKSFARHLTEPTGRFGPVVVPAGDGKRDSDSPVYPYYLDTCLDPLPEPLLSFPEKEAQQITGYG